MYRVGEVAEILGVSRWTLHKWFRNKAVTVGTPKPGMPLRQTMLIPRAVLEEWIEEHRGVAS